MVANCIVGKRANSVHIYSLAKADFVCVVAVSTAESFSKMVEKGDRGRLKDRTKNPRLRERQSHTKTDKRAALVRRIPATSGTATIDRIAAPRTATHHSVIICASVPGTSVRWGADIVFVGASHFCKYIKWKVDH